MLYKFILLICNQNKMSWLYIFIILICIQKKMPCLVIIKLKQPEIPTYFPSVQRHKSVKDFNIYLSLRQAQKLDGFDVWDWGVNLRKVPHQ